MTAARIRRIGETKDLLGESPCWDTRTRTLSWIDSVGGTLHRLCTDTGECDQYRLAAPIGSIAPCDSGAVLVALKDTLARYDCASGQLEVLARLGVDHPNVRLNDGKCDPWGNFIVGTMHVDRRPDEALAGGLYRLRADGTLERLAEDFSLVNGPCFSLDGHTLYVADSLLRTIWAYDYAPDRPLSGRRAFVQTERFGSGPDGATVDAAGFLWTVLTRVGKIARFAPDGTLDQLIDVPATHPTSLCFGGPGLDALYLTSISRSHRLTGPQPQDGGLFELRGLPSAGLAPHRYADA